MQAQGIEVGLVAKIAGHSNANVTLGHYTQDVRNDNKRAAYVLEEAYVAGETTRETLGEPYVPPSIGSSEILEEDPTDGTLLRVP